jgi:aminopeptidase
MPDTFVQMLARTLAHYSLDIRPADLLAVRSSTLGVPLLREIYREALRAGANVVCRLTFDGQDEIFYREAGEAQLEWVSPMDRVETESVTARLSINAPFNTRGNSGINPRRQTQHVRAQAELTTRFRQRSAEGAVRWCSTLFPTHALAQEAGMSLSDYEEFVYKAMLLDKDDPIAEWKAFSIEQQKKADFLGSVQNIRIVAPDTDLSVSVTGRKWMNSDGHRNFPSGEVFTGPLEESANGRIRFTYPAIAGGREVEDVRLWFEEGRVVKAAAARGQDYLQEMLDTDAGARYLGEIAIGNNYGIQRFTRTILFDEKIGGTCHLALGASYPETGGRNESAIHWDMVCDLRSGGEIYADGALIHKDGSWVIG